MKTKIHAIDPKYLKQLSILTPWRTVAACLMDWGVIAAAIAVSSHLSHPLVYLGAIMIIAGRMHALGVLMHEVAHYRFLKRHRFLAELLGDIFVAWPIMATVDGYRHNHLAHHRHTNTDSDPDWMVKKGTAQFSFPQRLSFGIVNLLGYIFAINTVRDLRRILRQLSETTKPTKAYTGLRIVFYLAILSIVAVTGSWIGLLLYWVVPFMTFLFMFQHVRSVAEHFGSMDYDHELSSTRTVKPYFWERWFFAPHNVNYHLEHHLCPAVPFYNLTKLHRMLLADDLYRERAHITRGYSTGLVKECFFPSGITGPAIRS
ncbi:MAG: fatty acid desaturase family protein [Salinisphaera sp.]|jgi:fatty acid desaturase|nr:fatty acid desaturase family protein [Salinisphaera sp.]